MTAKDKEKLKIMKSMVGQMKSDVIVIDPDEFRKRANIKNKEFYEVEKEAESKKENNAPGLSDAEILCCDIVIHIAHKTAERFEDMADGMEMSILKQIVRRIEDADPESVVPMFQTMFLARGMVDIAEDLDMLEICSKYDEEAFFVFYDVLFDTGIFEWFSVENMFDDFRNGDEQNKTD